MKKFALILTIIALSFSAAAQDFMLQGWYWDYPLLTENKRFAEYLSTRVDDMKEAGFTYAWLMPISRGSGGIYSVGYDVKDYYNLGDNGWSRFGRRSHLDLLLDSLDQAGIKSVADVIYNHRDGGLAETNPELKNYMLNLEYSDVENGDNPMPSDRYQLYLPIGGSTGNDAGDYYFKIRSKTQHPRFYSKEYFFEIWTNKRPPRSLPIEDEIEPNGGGDCGETFNTIQIQHTIKASIDAGGCGIDEFKLALDTADFFLGGDTIWMTLRTNNAGGFGDHADHYIHDIWAGPRNANIGNEVHYQTYTDFSTVSSGKGIMNWKNFRPNGNPTGLSGDWDGMWFYYDVDQSVQSTRDVLFEFTKWLWTDVNIRGYRMDAVKHFPPEFTGDLMDYLHDEGIDPGMVVGEFFDGNPGTLKWWVDAVKGSMDQDTRDNIYVRAFDFALRSSLKQACDGFGFDVRNVFNSGMVDGAGASGFDVVTFLNNHDFRHPGEEIENNPELGYAYILTNNQLGVPCVFYPDYFHNPDQAGYIKGLMEAHRKYIFGATDRYYLNNFNSGFGSNFFSGFSNTSLLYQLSNAQSGREVVVAINFAGETMKVDQYLETSNLSEGDTLTDIFGLSNFPFALVQNNQIYMELPPRSFSVWVEGDLQNELIATEAPFELISGITSENIDNGAEITAYPNPTSDRLTVTLKTEKPASASLQILSLDGKLMHSQALDKSGFQQLSIHTRKWPASLYFLQVTGDRFQESIPVVKSR